VTPNPDPLSLIKNAVLQRQIGDSVTDVYRLFNGFYEGYPSLVLDRYGSTLVIFDHGIPGESTDLIHEAAGWVLNNFVDLDSALLKQRQHPEETAKNGILIAGESLPVSIMESGVHYAIALQMHQDASFYPDTRNLRQWLIEHMEGKRVLNTFAYTGSLGVAAGTGGAAEVVQTDLSGKFLEIARKSWELNELDLIKCGILPGDFFRVTGQMRHQDRLFDCVILDPPFFSTTAAGRVDLQEETARLINKIRPLVTHEGWLVVINNALFLPGAAFMAELEKLCQSDYLSLAQLIPIPPDVTGYTDTVVALPPADPAPFNHPTKIAILRVTRKDKRK